MYKYIVFSALITLMSSSLFANTEMETKMRMLEQRVKELEASQDNSGGLKMTDMGNETVESRAPASATPAPQMDPAKQKEMMQQLEQFKKQREEGVKYLDQLEADGEL